MNKNQFPRKTRESKEFKVAISGAYGVPNIGDEALLFSIISVFRSLIPNISFTVLSSDPEHTEKHHGVKAVHREFDPTLLVLVKGKARTAFLTVARSDMLVIGGGTQLYEESIPPLRQIVRHWLALVAWAKLLRKRVVFYAVGVDPIRTKWKRQMIKLIVNRADLITVRDEESRDELMRIGVTKPIEVVADSCFGLQPISSDKLSVIFDKEHIRKTDLLIGVNLRGRPFPHPDLNWRSKPEQLDEFKLYWAQVCDSLIERFNAFLVFLPMEFPADVDLAKDVTKIMKQKNGCRVIADYYSPEEVLSIIGEMQLMIGMRLHSLIFATVMDVPSIAIDYGYKVKYFMKQAGQEKYTLDVTDRNADYLLNLVQELISNKESIKTQLKHRSMELKSAVVSPELISNIIPKTRLEE